MFVNEGDGTRPKLIALINAENAAVHLTFAEVLADTIVDRVRNMCLTVVIDMARLELILMNLASNAIKYCDPEKPHRFVRVEADMTTDEDFASIVVSENGLGIPESSQATVFRRFVRALEVS